MSQALVHFLVTLSDPVRFQEFERDKQSMMAAHGLTPGDIGAVLSGNSGKIRYQAKLPADVESAPESHPEYIAGSLSLDLVEIEVDLHVDVTTTNLTAIDKEFLLYDDNAGIMYRAVLAA